MKERVTRRKLFAAVPLLLTGLACSEIAVPSDNPVGTWAIKSVNGQAPPVALYSLGGSTTALSDDVLILRSNHTYAQTTVTRTAKNGTSIANAQPDSTINMGGWDLTSGDLTVGVAPSTLSGNLLTVRWSSAMATVYQRQ